MTDPQQLRAIVAAWWEDTFVDTDCVIDRSGNYRSAEDCIEDIVVRARAALADGPAVPQGREPGAADLEKEFRYWWKEIHGSPYFGAVPLVAVLSWTEYALARWGNPVPAPPADGEVAELVAWLKKKRASYELFGCYDAAARITRAAELLQRQALVPVSVSERPPGPEDCDAEGRCWWGTPGFVNSCTVAQSAQWRLSTPDDRFGSELFWLPAHALPLPEVGE